VPPSLGSIGNPKRGATWGVCSTEVPFFEALRADLPKLRTTPLLLLYGIKDHGYQAGFLKQWKSVVPEASVILLQRSGHFAPEDEPETFTAALSEWLAGRGARQPSASV
jgi:pimeloyl-ACP methyl ester carboxylesterase